MINLNPTPVFRVFIDTPFRDGALNIKNSIFKADADFVKGQQSQHTFRLDSTRITRFVVGIVLCLPIINVIVDLAIRYLFSNKKIVEKAVPKDVVALSKTDKTRESQPEVKKHCYCILAKKWESLREHDFGNATTGFTGDLPPENFFRTTDTEKVISQATPKIIAFLKECGYSQPRMTSKINSEFTPLCAPWLKPGDVASSIHFSFFLNDNEKLEITLPLGGFSTLPSIGDFESYCFNVIKSAILIKQYPRLELNYPMVSVDEISDFFNNSIKSQALAVLQEIGFKTITFTAALCDKETFDDLPGSGTSANVNYEISIEGVKMVFSTPINYNFSVGRKWINTCCYLEDIFSHISNQAVDNVKNERLIALISALSLVNKVDSA